MKILIFVRPIFPKRLYFKRKTSGGQKTGPRKKLTRSLRGSTFTDVFITQTGAYVGAYAKLTHAHAAAENQRDLFVKKNLLNT